LVLPTTNQLPTTNSHQPTPINQPPSTINHQPKPTAHSQQPIANNQQPTAQSREKKVKTVASIKIKKIHWLSKVKKPKRILFSFCLARYKIQ
jgi:hypothetical protein